MKKNESNKSSAQKTSATTLQASSGGDWQFPQKRNESDPRPAHWNRYVDSRLKQFCLR